MAQALNEGPVLSFYGDKGDDKIIPTRLPWPRVVKVMTHFRLKVPLTAT